MRNQIDAAVAARLQGLTLALQMAWKTDFKSVGIPLRHLSLDVFWAYDDISRFCPVGKSAEARRQGGNERAKEKGYLKQETLPWDGFPEVPSDCFWNSH